MFHITVLFVVCIYTLVVSKLFDPDRFLKRTLVSRPDLHKEVLGQPRDDLCRAVFNTFRRPNQVAMIPTSKPKLIQRFNVFICVQCVSICINVL